jgi:beta-lactam-binding protein with PASTA domain
MRKTVTLAAVAAALAAGLAGSATAGSTQRARVPNEIGRNHQKAQDDLQAHGFYNLRERDCTGRGRMLIWDRNWKVVRQSPRPGARVSTDAVVTLCSIKYTDE